MFHGKSGRHIHFGCEILLQDEATVGLDQQANSLEEIVWRRDEDRVGRDLYRLGQHGQYLPHSVAIGSDQSPCPQLGAPEVARHDDGYVPQPTPAQNSQRRAPGGTGRLAIVATVSDDRGAMADQVNGNVVRRVGKFVSDASDKSFRLI